MRSFLGNEAANKQINKVDRLVKEGLSDQEIAEQMTVDREVNLKTNSESWSEADIEAIRRGFNLSPGASFLDDISTVVEKAIRGIFLFLWRLPRWAWNFTRDFLDRFFPIISKLVKIVFLLALWVFLVFSPLLSVSVLLDTTNPTLNLAAWLWTGAAFMGSVWGVAVLRKVRRKGKIKFIEEE